MAVPEALRLRGGDRTRSRLDHPGDKVLFSLALACLREEYRVGVCFLTTHTSPVLQTADRSHPCATNMALFIVYHYLETRRMGVGVTWVWSVMWKGVALWMKMITWKRTVMWMRKMTLERTVDSGSKMKGGDHRVEVRDLSV